MPSDLEKLTGLLSMVEENARLHHENMHLRISNAQVWRYYEQALERANLIERLATQRLTTRRRQLKVTQ